MNQGKKNFRFTVAFTLFVAEVVAVGVAFAQQPAKSVLLNEESSNNSRSMIGDNQPFSGAKHLVDNAEVLRAIEPETSLLLIFEKDKRATMELVNQSGQTALLKSEVVDTKSSQMQAPVVHVLQPVLRLNDKERARVRFQLEIPQGMTELEVQHIKRVTFETIPPAVKSEGSLVFNIKYEIPLLIHPAKLKWENEPWRHIQWCMDAGSLVAVNNSPYAIRAVEEVMLHPSGKVVRAFPDNLLPPKSRVNVDVTGEKGSIERVSIVPATAWGSVVPSKWEVALAATCPAVDSKLSLH